MADMYDLKANVPASAAPKPATAGLATLMPADPKKGYSTPYYAAYTNDGDMAGAVMVAEGQKVRLVDKLTGDVVYEGVGPQAAEIATATANSISKDKGRGAAWAIQKPTEDGGWVSMAEERYDPKKQGFWGKLADIALPVLGAILAPMTGGLSMLGAAGAAGVGAAGGSLLASASNRRDMDEALKRAAIAGVTAGVGAKVMPMVGKALANAPQNAVTNALNTGYDAVMRPLNAGVNVVRGAAGAGSGAGAGVAGTVAPVTVIGNSVVPAISGGAIGSTIGGLIPTSTALGPNSPAGALSQGADTLSGTEVEEVVVEPETAGNVVPGAVVGTIGSDVVLRDNTIPTNVEDLKQPPQLDDKNALLEWVKANPGLAARLGLTAAGLVGGSAGGGGSGSGGGIPPGFATAGTPGSLSDRFRAQLPAPSGPFSDLSARNVSMTPEQWKTYGERSAMSFFNNVPVRPSGITPAKPPGGRVVGPRVSPSEVEPGLTVAGRPLGAQGAAPTQPVPGFNPTAPSSVSSTTGSDMNRSRMTPEQFAVTMQRMENARRAQPLPGPAKGFKTGGFAVSGPGTGRSDDIPARLSDGEYVIDAETVALLGDGSTQAGSKRLDEFRVNIRKHKGKQLSKGNFSHDARKPEAYLQGGRV